MYCINHPYSKNHTTGQCRLKTTKRKKNPSKKSHDGLSTTAQRDVTPPSPPSRPYARLLATLAPTITPRVLVNGDDPDRPLPLRTSAIREKLQDFEYDLQGLIDLLPARHAFFDQVLVLLEANLREYWHFDDQGISLARRSYANILNDISNWSSALLSTLKDIAGNALKLLDKPGMDATQSYQMINIFLGDVRELYGQYDHAVGENARFFNEVHLWHGLLDHASPQAVVVREYLGWLHSVRPMTPEHFIGNLVPPEVPELPDLKHT